MRIYEDYSQSPDGWKVEATLKLEDDGRFGYEEKWADYTNVALYGGAGGRWRRDADGVVFLAEHVEGSMYFAWEVGQELKAFERGDTLDFGRGWTLRIPPEREVNVPVRNTGAKPLTVRPRAAVVPEQKQTRAAAPPRTHAAAARHAAAPPAPARVAAPEYPRFKPRTPSPELAARIRQWVEDLPADGLRYLCKEHDALPLHATQIYLWVLRADGQVLCIDHESFAQRPEPETDPVRAYAALAQGEREHPELGELLPPDRAGLRGCEECGGEGWREARPPAQGTTYCQRCDGMGWYAPGALR